VTAADGAGMMTDREVEDVTLAREIAAQRGEVGALAGAVAEWADWELAGGRSPTWIVHRMITAGRLIAAAARGEAATL
jgi:hypothetical protein